MDGKTVPALRAEMGRLMRERGIRTLAGATSPTAWSSRLGEPPDERAFFTGYDCGRLFGWDQYFEAILQVYAGWETDLVRNSLRMFLERAGRDGFIPRTLPLVWWGMFHQQPFLAQQALLLARTSDDLAWFYPEYYYSLKGYLLHWLRDLDVRGAGLSVWDHAGHTGMDNQYERAGTFRDAYCEGVDLNSYLVRECDAFALLARACRQPADEAAFGERAARKREAIRRWCWDEGEGIFYDRHAREDRPIRVRHAGIFAALWAGVPDERQARRLVREHLLHEAGFMRPYPIPALAATEPGYIEGYLPDEPLDCCSWRAHAWIPVNYYAMHGLRRYGFADAARDLARRTREMFCRAPFREYYGAESGAPCGRDPFWGWSSLALFMEDEVETGCDPTALTLDPWVPAGRVRPGGAP